MHFRRFIIVNVMPVNEQKILVSGTLTAEKEVETLNRLLEKDKGVLIVVYGRCSCDVKALNKAKQLQSLGFTNVSVYVGGLFEWLLLGELYGYDEFPVTDVPLDILKYSGCSGKLGITL